MCGGGKGVQQTSQNVSYPSWPAALAYNQAMSKIDAATSTPFQRYSSDPNAYVASLNPTQTGAIQNVTGMQGMTDPYFQGATGLTMAGAAPVGRLTSGQIQEYMNPFMSQVVDPVKAALGQQFGQQLSQQQAEAIRNNAFGGSRSNVARALLQGQQGLALGQALSPLYQTGYGQALQTAKGQQGVEAANLQRLLGAGSQLGGLGTAAQNAALQQASAQLQGGTLQQQTETAQKQALYGEAQKERMYPLQVAQLYAQTAGGLGPLMGGQTQGFQQMPFFGGFAADGGAIDGPEGGLGAARMGGAVIDLEPGKDYQRGGFAGGGDVDLSGLVAQQRAAITPNIEDVPFPTSEIRPGRAPETGPLPERRQGIIERGLGAAMSDPSGTYDKAGKLYEGMGKVRDYFNSPSSSGGLNLASETLGRGLYAAGGDVENDAMSNLLSHPVQASDAPQPSGDDPQKKGSGLLGGLIKTGASLAANTFLPGSGALVSGGLSALGMATGGRAEYATDGGVGGDDMDAYLRPLARIESGGEKDPYSAIGPTTKYGHALGKYQIMEGNVPEWTKAALGRAMTRDEFLGNREAQEATARHRFGQYLEKAGTPEGAAAMWFGGPGYAKHMNARDVLGTSIPQYMAKYKAGLGEPDLSKLGSRERSMMALYPDAKAAPAGVVPGERGIGSGQVSDKGFMERVEEKPERLIVPILQGLGAMAGSKNRYALGAIAEGLGAGAGSYMDMQQKEADIRMRQQEAAREAEETRKRAAEVGQVEATTGLLGAETGEKIMQIAGGAFKQVGPDWFVLNDQGQWVHLEKWRQEGGNLVGGAPAAAAAAALANRGGTGSAPESGVPGAPAPRATQPPPMPPTTPVTITPGVVWNPEAEKLAKNEYGKFTGPGAAAMQEKSDRYVKQATEGADAAFATRPMHSDVARIIAQAATQKGLNAPGVGFTATSGIVGTLNRIANAAGVPGDVFGSARTQQDLSDKLNGISARLATSEAGQHALGALQTTIQTMPDLNKTPAAAAENAADNIMNNQRAADRLAHMRKYGSLSNNRFSDADTAFNTTNTAVKYNQERDAIRDLIIGKIPTPEGARTNVKKAHEILDKMYDPKVPPEAIDKFFKEHYGLDNMSRYFR